MFPDINSAIMDIAAEGAMRDHKKDLTVTYLSEEVPLLKNAVKMIDITNLRLGPYTSTALNKINQQKEVLELNHEKISDRVKNNLLRKYNKMIEILNEKIAYGQKVTLYLDAKENDVVEVIKSNLLEDDLAEFEKIRVTLISFKKDLIDLAEDIEKSVYRLKKDKKAV